MSKTASLTLHTSRGLIERIISFLDLAALAAARNGDPVGFGL
jgi:hypothetical protein